LERVDLTALQVAVYRRLPRRLRRPAVRLATPSFTVGAVALVTMDGSQLLLVRTSYRTGWVPPGGFVDRGEEPLQTLRREMREELGLDLEFAPWHRVSFDTRRRGIGFLSVAVAPPGTVGVPQSPEVLEARWFPLDALPPLSHDYREGLDPADLDAVRSAGLRR
jgi:ADP-ribose pyrophosphatase YjhB (NUDIX family)